MSNETTQCNEYCFSQVFLKFVINGSMDDKGICLFVPGKNTTGFEICLQDLKYQQGSGKVRKMIYGGEWQETYTVICRVVP